MKPSVYQHFFVLKGASAGFSVGAFSMAYSRGGVVKTIDALREALRRKGYLAVYTKESGMEAPQNGYGAILMPEHGKDVVHVYCHDVNVLTATPDGGRLEGMGDHLALLEVTWWEALGRPFDTQSPVMRQLLLHAMRADSAEPSQEVRGLCLEFEQGFYAGSAPPEPKGTGVWEDRNWSVKYAWEDGWRVQGTQNPDTGEWDDLTVERIGVSTAQIRRRGEFLPMAKFPPVVHRLCREHFGVILPVSLADQIFQRYVENMLRAFAYDVGRELWLPGLVRLELYSFIMGFSVAGLAADVPSRTEKKFELFVPKSWCALGRRSAGRCMSRTRNERVDLEIFVRQYPREGGALLVLSAEVEVILPGNSGYNRRLSQPGDDWLLWTGARLGL